MTFIEAAIEVLRREGKPLPTQRLADLAVKHNLLSVVGRDPEATMEQRLEDLFSRGPHPELLQIKPGVYGLRSYPERSEAREPAASPVEDGEATAGQAQEGAGKSGRRRRGRRGRGAKDAAPTEKESAAAAAPAKEEAPARPAAPAAAAEGEKSPRRGRRRGGRGRRRGGRGGEAVAAGDETAAETQAPLDAREAPAPMDDEDDDAREVAADDAPVATAPEAEGGAGDDATADAAPAGEAAEVERPADEDAARDRRETVEPSPDSELLDEELGGEGELLDDEVDLPSGPLMAPTLGAEELTRSEDDRELRAAIPGRRGEERGRHRRGRPERKGRGREGAGREEQPRAARDAHPREDHARAPRDEHARAPREEHARAPREDQRAPRDEHARAPREDQPREPAPTGTEADDRAPRSGRLLDALLELLRGGDGRPLHVRHLVDLGVKRKLLDPRTPPVELLRQARAALGRELREREAEGLRPRVRGLGGGHFAAVDKKLEPELAAAERELADRAARLREATRASLRRRLTRMSPPSFETLTRALLEKLGLSNVELVRRGEGVAYFGGLLASGVGGSRTLVSVRPGEAEISRRAVGELRAGLAAKGFDQGLLLAAGRASGEALAELKNGAQLTVYDGAALAQLLIKHGLGTRRVWLPVDYLDLELLSDVTE